MKTLFINLIFWLLLCQNTLAQNNLPNVNYIDCDQYGQFTFNGHTIRPINESDGDSVEIKKLYGQFSSFDFDSSTSVGTFYYQENKLKYDYESGFAREIIINSKSWPVSLKEKKIEVSNSIENVRKDLGQKLKKNPSAQSPFDEYRFKCINYLDDVNLKVNNTTNKIVQIRYWISSIPQK